MKRPPVLVDLALQGSGAHGAFTWGVLDRLLEEPWLRIEGISGTSAGAMNAAVLVDGYTKGGLMHSIWLLIRHGWSRVSDWFVRRWLGFEGWREDRQRRLPRS